MTRQNCTLMDDCECSKCAASQGEYDNIVRFVRDMPQFDVPAQLTQSVMAVVAAQPAYISAASALLLPLAVAGGAFSFAFAPFDTVEGLLSSGVAAMTLFGIQRVLRGADTEEMVA